MAISRQRRWQKKQQAAGNCQICGKERGEDRTYCEECRPGRAEMARVRYHLRRGQDVPPRGLLGRSPTIIDSEEVTDA